MISAVAAASSQSQDLSWPDVIVTLASFALLGFIVWVAYRK